MTFVIIIFVSISNIILIILK